MEELRPAAGPQAIEAYGPGSFTIAGLRHRGSILVLADRALAWAPTSTAEITLDAACHRLGPGGFVAFPPGGPAHAVANPSASDDLVVLAGGENAPGEIVDFPQAGRRIVRGRDLFEIAAADSFGPFDYFSKTPLPESLA